MNEEFRNIMEMHTRAELEKIPIQRNYNTKDGSPLERFDTLADWTNKYATGGNIESDITNYKVGSAGLKLNVTLAGSDCYCDKTINYNFKNTNKIIKVWAYFHTASYNVGAITLYLSSTANFSKSYMGQVECLNCKQGWNLLVFDANNFTTGDGESWDNTMITMRIKVSGRVTYTTSVTFSDMQCDVVATPKIIFTFDDGSDGAYTKAFPYMFARRIKGVAYVIPSLVATTAHMTLANLHTLYNAGWDISNHTYNHLDLSAKTQAEVESEFKTAQDYLQSNGFTNSARFASLPNGIWNDTIRAAIGSVGVLAARNSNDQLTIPEAMDLYMIPPKTVVNTTSVATVTGWIDRAVANNETLVLMFHQIKDTATVTYEYSTANFNSIIDYIYTNAYEKHVVTMSEFYNGLHR